MRRGGVAGLQTTRLKSYVFAGVRVVLIALLIYKQFIRDGHPIEDIEPYLNDDDLELYRTTSDDGVWSPSRI